MRINFHIVFTYNEIEIHTSFFLKDQPLMFFVNESYLEHGPRSFHKWNRFHTHIFPLRAPKCRCYTIRWVFELKQCNWVWLSSDRSSPIVTQIMPHVWDNTVYIRFRSYVGEMKFQNRGKSNNIFHGKTSKRFFLE